MFKVAERENLNTVLEQFCVNCVNAVEQSGRTPRDWEDTAMVGEFITFLHRNIRIVTPAVLLVAAGAVFAIAHLLHAR